MQETRSAVPLLRQKAGCKPTGTGAKRVLWLIRGTAGLHARGLPASKVTGSLNAFTAAPVPGKELGYFCQSKREEPTGERKGLTHAPELGAETRGNAVKPLFWLRGADCNDPGLETQGHQAAGAKSYLNESFSSPELAGGLRSLPDHPG